jgi:hypothetical protein
MHFGRWRMAQRRAAGCEDRGRPTPVALEAVVATSLAQGGLSGQQPGLCGRPPTPVANATDVRDLQRSFTLGTPKPIPPIPCTGSVGANLLFGDGADQ